MCLCLFYAILMAAALVPYVAMPFLDGLKSRKTHNFWCSKFYDRMLRLSSSSGQVPGFEDPSWRYYLLLTGPAAAAGGSAKFSWFTGDSVSSKSWPRAGLLGGVTVHQPRVLNKFASKPLHKMQWDVRRFKGKLRYVSTFIKVNPVPGVKFSF